MECSIALRIEAIRPTAVVRCRASLAELPIVVPEACGKVWALVKSQGIAKAGRLVAVYLDSQINLEVGVELDSPIVGAGDLIGSAIPAGRVAAMTHFGPYQRLPAAHTAIRLWCATHGHALAGPNWELYGHWRDEWNQDPSKIVTEVVYLLAPNP